MANMNASRSGDLFAEDMMPELDDRLNCIVRELDILERPRPLDSRETELLIELLEGWAHKENWDPVLEWSSTVVLEGCPFRYSVVLYRFWIEALYRNHDLEGVYTLSRHLLGFRYETREYLALSLLGLTLCGNERFARRVARSLFASERKSVLVVEALARFNLEFLSRERRKQSLKIYERVCEQQKFPYCSLLAWVECALVEDDHEQAARALAALHERYPFSQEPLKAALQLAIDESDWVEAVRLARKLYRINPTSAENIASLATAMEYKGELLAARSLLQQHAHCFEKDDYDFVATSASVAYKLYRLYQEETFRGEAIRYFAQGMKIAPKFGIGTANFHSALHRLNAGVGEKALPRRRDVNDTDPRFWLLMADGEGWKHALMRQSFLLQVPLDVQMGDYIFVCRGDSVADMAHCGVDGMLEVLTPQIPDEHLERVVKVGHFKMFGDSVQFSRTEEPILEHNGHGLCNFSNRSQLYFSQLSAENAEEIVSRVENLDNPFKGKLVSRYA